MIIIDHRMPDTAKEKLGSFGELMEVRTEEITYPAISGHPDIFMCQAPGKLIVAPNLPDPIMGKLRDICPELITGEFPVGAGYPDTARYNAVVTDRYIIHNFRHTDFSITRAFEDHIPVHVDQGYCRCNLLWLKNDVFITSDEGICKVLKRYSEHILKVSPEGIVLEGFPHGFFGGCCGVWEEKVFVCGSLDHYKDGELVRAFLEGSGYEIEELYDGPFVDVGGILTLRVFENGHPSGLRK